MSDADSVSHTAGNEDSNSLVLRKFERALRESDDVLSGLGYREQDDLHRLGALERVRQVLKDKAGSKGFTRLWDMGKLRFSIEAIVLRPEFRQLFNEREREIARDRLADRGYVPDD